MSRHATGSSPAELTQLVVELEAAEHCAQFLADALEAAHRVASRENPTASMVLEPMLGEARQSVYRLRLLRELNGDTRERRRENAAKRRHAIGAEQ